jgi:predicted RNase H-like HicB family nuclease
MTIVSKGVGQMKTYTFTVVLEKDKWPDEPDEKAVWQAYIPQLKDKGGATWGDTKAEALKNIEEVAQMTIESMIEHNEPIPSEPFKEVCGAQTPFVVVTV